MKRSDRIARYALERYLCSWAFAAKLGVPLAVAAVAGLAALSSCPSMGSVRGKGQIEFEGEIPQRQAAEPEEEEPDTGS